MEIWVGMLNVRPGPDGTGGAYVYCAARAGSAAEAIAAVSGERFEIGSVEWLAPYATLNERRRESEAVAGVMKALGDGDVALDYFFSYPEGGGEPDAADELKERVEGFVEGWIEGAVEECGPFALGEFAFVAEMRFPDDDEPELGWAYVGDLDNAPALFARAADVAARDE
jgi:hypothetical protein